MHGLRQPDPGGSRTRVGPARNATEGLEGLAAKLEKSDEILADLWSIAEGLAKNEPGSDVLALYIDSLNETIDMDTNRVTAALHARVPDTVLLLLIVGSALTLGMVGFSAGLTRRRSPLTAIVMIIVLGAVITLIIDIDRPQGGTLTVSQQPIVELQEQLESTTP